MEHSQATDTMASARYLLDEMTDEERDAFEEHYFACPECARDVRDGSAMIDSIRAGRVVRRTGSAATTLPWFLTAAAAVALALLGIQNARLREPHVLRSYSLLTMGTRGASQPAVIEDPSKPFALYVDIPPPPAYPNYRIEIRDSSNRAKVSVPVNATEARETITVYVPARILRSGKYAVVIVGGDSSLVGSTPLDVR